MPDARGAPAPARARRAAEHARELAERDARPGAAAPARRRRTRRSSTRCRPRRRRRRGSAPTRVAEVVGDVRARSSARCGRSGSPTARRCRPAGRRRRASSARATGCDGTRRPTVSWPPVTTSATPRRARQDQRQRSRPERGGEPRARPSGIVARPARELRRRRRGARSPDGRPGDPWRRRCVRTASRVARVRAEAVDGLGREGDELAGAQRGRGASRSASGVGATMRCVIAAPRSRAVRHAAGTGSAARSARIQVFASAPAPVAARPRSGAQHAQGAAMSDFLFTSESVSEGHPDKVADQISDAVLDAILEQDPTARVAAETLVSTGLVVMSGEITTGAQARLRAHRARDDPPDRLQRPGAALRRRRLRGDGLLRPPVARHRARRRPRLRRIPQPGRRRPGPDVRLRLRRDAVADAVPDLLRAPAGAAAERGAQGRPPAVAAPRRQVAGDGALRRRQAGRDRHRRAVDAAPPAA